MMINQKPQRVLFSRWGLAYLEPCHLDSSLAASESLTFIRNSRRNSRDDGYRYDVFKITLRHLNYTYVYDGSSDRNGAPIWTRYRRRIGTLNGISCGRYADKLYSIRKIRFLNLVCPMTFFYRAINAGYSDRLIPEPVA